MIATYLVLNGLILLFGVTAITWSDQIRAQTKCVLSFLYVLLVVGSTVVSFLISQTESHEADERHSALTNRIGELKQELAASQRRPEFQLFVNSVVITNFSDVLFPTSMGTRKIRQAALLLPTTNAEQSVALSIRNIGNLPADKLSVGIRFSRESGLVTGGAWAQMGTMNRTSEGLKQDDSQASYYIDSAHVIDPGAFFSCDQLFLKSAVTQATPIPLSIEVSSLGAEKERFSLTIIFVPGTGVPEAAVRTGG